MAKEETFEVMGVVIDARPNEQFLVKITLSDKEGKESKETDILATLSGNIRKYRIRITEGDTVKVCMSHYDLRRGRIT